MQIDPWSIAAAIVSILLAIVAIWQAMYFYTQAKNTEARVQIALEGIKSQTEALQALNARTLDRLTKYVTTPRDEGRTTDLLAVTIRELPDVIAKLAPPSQSASEAQLRREIVTAYIALWNYTATANRWAAFCLPAPEKFDDAQPYDSYVRQVVDRSAADFRTMTGIVAKLTPDEIKASGLAHFYDEVQTGLIKYVRDTAQTFAEKAKEPQARG